MGSVFSPYYRSAWKAGHAVAEDHCAINVALYSPGATRWAMTERGQRHVQRSAHHFQVGPSSLRWDGQGLTIDLHERANPLPRKVSGTIRVVPTGLCDYVTALDDAGRHRWGPIAPCARVELAMDAPALRWQGHGYLDSNEGDEPISEPFHTWDWLRAPLADGSTVVAYDVRCKPGRDGRLIGTRFWPDGRAAPVALPPRVPLPRSGWRVGRHVRSEAPAAAAVVRTLEDTPFYARSVVRTHLCGQPVTAMHESFHARRFAAPWVQALLPFRMPRRA